MVTTMYLSPISTIIVLSDQDLTDIGVWSDVLAAVGLRQIS